MENLSIRTQDQMIKAIGKKKEIKRIDLSDKERKLAVDLENKGLIKRKKKEKKTDNLVFVLTQKGREQYEEKYKK